tara:strand:+ start:324 stop:2627 length:2304 start_codon:yes stop_codon:yes gene_type:complete
VVSSLPNQNDRVKRSESYHKDLQIKSAMNDTSISPYVLHANTPFRGVWDAAQIIILCYVALAVPYRMGFDADAYGGWYVLEFLVDLYFWIDLSFGFFTAYWEHRKDTDEVVYVVDLDKITRHYLQTWFLVDFLACLPIDYIARGSRGLSSCSWDITSSDPCAGKERNLSSAANGVLNFFALLRLLKLLRIVRAVRIFARYEEYFLMYHLQVSMTKLLVVLCLLSHWMACMYGSVYDFEREDYAGTNMRSWELYVGSLFWAVQTLTTVGYGNVVPQTVSERLLACGVMLLGGFVFSMIIGKVSSLLSADSAENQEVERSLSLRRFIDGRNVPRSLALRIHSYRKYVAENSKPGDREVIAELPKHIRVDVNFFVYGRVVVSALSGDILPNETIIERVCIDMRPTVFTRDVSLATAGHHTDLIAILMEGTCVVAQNEESLFKDDGTPETRYSHREISKHAKPGDARLCDPGFLINPGLAFGFTRATLCVLPYDTTVEAAVWHPAAFCEMLKDTQPKLKRNVFDAFLKQLRNSRRAMQRLATQQINRNDLWDDTRKTLNTGWHAQVRAERVREDKLIEEQGGVFGADADDTMEAAKLEELSQTEKIEAVQRQVQKMHVDLADVGNRIKDAEKTQKSVGATSGAELRKFQDKMIQVMDAHSERVHGLETAVDGIVRMLQQVIDDKDKLSGSKGGKKRDDAKKREEASGYDDTRSQSQSRRPVIATSSGRGEQAHGRSDRVSERSSERRGRGEQPRLSSRSKSRDGQPGFDRI